MGMTEPQTSLTVRLKVNGIGHEKTVEARLLLSDFLRQVVGLTGTRVGCEHGVCGACTILLDGAAVRSCLLFAAQVDGCDIRTVEGLADADGRLGILQEAFRDKHALQCGYCTAGMLTTLTAWLAEHPDPSEADIRDAISGNLCRCTGYQNIVAAALLAAARLRKAGDA
jgi:aerobic-type carbon monoxide dehydrogenase small subunit (CoxS/CutS family)